jgi:acyl carrier protein
MPTILERLRKLVALRLGVDEDQVVPDASFTQDFGADSIELLELVMSIEEEFSTPSQEVRIPDSDLDRITTVAEAMDYLKGLGISDD